MLFNESNFSFILKLAATTGIYSKLRLFLKKTLFIYSCNTWIVTKVFERSVLSIISKYFTNFMQICKKQTNVILNFNLKKQNNSMWCCLNSWSIGEDQGEKRASTFNQIITKTKMDDTTTPEANFPLVEYATSNDHFHHHPISYLLHTCVKSVHLILAEIITKWNELKSQSDNILLVYCNCTNISFREYLVFFGNQKCNFSKHF